MVPENSNFVTDPSAPTGGNAVQEMSPTPIIVDKKTEKRQMKMNKMMEKRIRQRLERRQRLINSGTPEDKVDQVMAEQDWAAMPLADKFKMLVHNINESFKRFAQDMMNVRTNQDMLADSMDVNFRAFAKMLEKAGVSAEVQAQCMKEAEDELAADKKKALEAQAEQVKKQAEQTEKQKVEAELKSVEGITSAGASNVDANGTPVQDGATTFGG